MTRRVPPIVPDPPGVRGDPTKFNQIDMVRIPMTWRGSLEMFKVGSSRYLTHFTLTRILSPQPAISKFLRHGKVDLGPLEIIIGAS